MANQPGIRKILQLEDTKYAAAVSESLGSRLAQATNFINFNQTTWRGWVLNGIYGNDTAAQISVDGAMMFDKDCEIVFFGMYNSVAGSAGITEIDIKLHTASNQVGTSIFSTKPSMSYTTGNNGMLAIAYDPNVTLQNPSGTVLPIFSSRNISAGDALTLDFVTRQAAAQSLTISLAIRPR